MTNMTAHCRSLSLSLLLVSALVGCPQTVPVGPQPPADGTAAPASVGSLAGRVRQAASGEPIGEAVIAVVGTGQQVTTDPDGWFSLAELPLGPVTLEVTGPGFERFFQEIVIRTGLQGVELMTGETSTGHLPFIRAITGTLSNGNAKAGQGLVIHGEHFGDVMAFVLINDQAMPIRIWKDTSIALLVDPQRVPAGPVTLVVQRPDGARSSIPLVIEQLPVLPNYGGGGSSGGGGGSPGGGGSAATGPADPQDDLLYESNFGATAVGEAPADWIDVRQDTASPPSWLHPGRWSIASQTDALPGMVLRQAQLAPQPYFTMRRYAGNAFRSNDGAVPSRYTVTATVQPGESPHYRSPVGEVALLVHYRDCRNYVQLVLSKNNVALYEAVDAEPQQSEGWNGIHWYPVSAQVGSVHTIGALIDSNQGTIQPMVDGQWKFPITIDSLKAPGRHYVALRSAGNAMSVGKVTIDSRL